MVLLLDLESRWGLLVTSEHVAKSQIVSSISGTQVLLDNFFFCGEMILLHTVVYGTEDFNNSTRYDLFRTYSLFNASVCE